ncbi:MAG TPA: glycine zipper 2TM domain-containing protein [Paucimonas sp.]|nr:glycine zipper 2TM domain-containing protein [Paucimonas sp.]HJW57049.1 glycine zipper 2TM domain-containing protein [Burkholderiaceae bacterium]
MNKLVNLSFCLFCVGAASIVDAADFEDYARVVSVTPQVEQFNQPHQECHTEYVQVQRQQQRGIGGSIIGGLAGGIIGNQVGGGTGRTAATAAGAIAGAIVGDRMGNSDNAVVTEQQPVRQCRMVEHWESRTVGYQVTYDYRGHSYTSVMAYDPGERVKLHVSLTPR